MNEATVLLIWMAGHAALLALVLVIAFAVGDVFLQSLAFTSAIERAVLTITLGLGLCALVLFVLAVSGLLSPKVVVAGTCLGGLAATWRLSRILRKVAFSEIWSHLRGLSQLQIALLLGLSGFWALLLLPTLYPPVQWDATAYHLVLARRYLDAAQIEPHPGVHWPIVPALNQLLFSWALALKDDVLAQMVEHAFLMLTALGLYAWGQRSRQPLLGLAAAMLWVSHPLVRWLGASAYIDVGLTCFVFLAIYAFRVCWEERDGRFWLLGLALASCAVGTKATGMATFCLALAFALLAAKRFGWSRMRLLQGVGVCLALACPWYVLIGIYSGNPVWPLFAKYSQGIWADPQVIRYIEAHWWRVVPVTPINYLFLPVALVFNLDVFRPDDNLNLLPLLAVFPICWLVALWDRSVRWWVLWAGAIMLAWFVSSQTVRLLLPALPLMGLAILESFRWLSIRLRSSSESLMRFYMVIILSATLVGGGVMSYQALKRGAPPTRSEQRELWLGKRVWGYRATQFFNRQAQTRDSVYLINLDWLAYHCRVPARSVNSSLEQALIPPGDAWPSTKWGPRLKSEGVGWILLDLNRDEFTASGSPQESPLEGIFGPDYKMVFKDEEACVFQVVDQQVVDQ